MSIATALTALNADVEAAKAAIENKGGTAPSGTADMADAIAAIPSGGITPSGSVTLTEEDTYDVTDKAQAIVDFSATRANLAEAVTAKGVDTLPTASFDTIAVNIGLISGGGSLPSSITKIDGGNFTVNTRKAGDTVPINHNLGVVPKFYAIWTDEIELSTAEDVTIMSGTFVLNAAVGGTASAYLHQMGIRSNTFNPYSRSLGNNYSGFANSVRILYNISGSSYAPGLTYYWVAFA